MSPPLPDRALRAFGRTEGDADDLGLLVRDQDTRRLVLLRALLDAAGAAPRSSAHRTGSTGCARTGRCSKPPNARTGPPSARCCCTLWWARGRRAVCGA